MAKLKTLNYKAKLQGKRVLLRLDLNVPLDTSGGRTTVADAGRITEALPSILRLQRAGARTIIISHLGDPDGKVINKLKLHPVAANLRQRLPAGVTLIEHPSWNWSTITKAVAELLPGQILILENLRFCKGEEANDKNFAKQLAKLADIYVNEAFSVSHRLHASVAAITKYLPAYAGWHLAEEVAILTKVRDQARLPLVVLLGGAKVHDKTDLMTSLAKSASVILVGGVIANTIWHQRAISIGQSTVDKHPDVKKLKGILKESRLVKKIRQPLVILPVDVVVAKGKNGQPRIVNFSKNDTVKAGEAIFDIGPATIAIYAAKLRQAKTIIWNGPLGLIEVKKFSHGSLALARLIAALSRRRAFGVVGGGESLEILHRTKVAGDIDWCSTGGGAMLALLANRRLPGLAALSKS